MSAITTLLRVADDIESRAKMNPDRWGDLEFIANSIREQVNYEMEDDE